MFVWSQKFSLRVWTPIYEHVQICLMFGMSLENDVRVRSMFDKMLFDPSLKSMYLKTKGYSKFKSVNQLPNCFKLMRCGYEHPVVKS